MNCTDFILDLVAKNQDIKYLEFVSFESYSMIQERVANKEISAAIENALAVRSELKLPFWDSFNLSLFNKSFSDFDFLNQVRFHNKKKEIFVVDRNSVLSFISKREQDPYLTINSKVTLNNGQIRHIPLLDFHIPISHENEEISFAVLKALGVVGVLFDSGKSYHFYGDKLINENQLIELLSVALLFSPIIDKTWIAHQLLEKSCCLRVSMKYDRLPFVVNHT